LKIAQPAPQPDAGPLGTLAQGGVFIELIGAYPARVSRALGAGGRAAGGVGPSQHTEWLMKCQEIRLYFGLKHAFSGLKLLL